MTLLSVIREIHPDRIGFNPRQFDRLAGGAGLREAIERASPPERIVAIVAARPGRSSASACDRT